MKWIAPIFLLAALASSSVRASLKVVESSEEIPERGTVTRLIIKTDAGIFSLNPPAGWSSEVNARDESLNFQLERGSAALSVKFSTNAPPASPEQMTAFVEDHWPNARILERASSFTQDREGHMVECLYHAAGTSIYRTRAAIIPCRGGHVEFLLSAPDGWPPALHNSWTALLNSFKAEQASARKFFATRR